MARGVSTVLDVTVCLLLVGAALATLSAAPSARTDTGPTADVPARTIATATTGIQYRTDTRHTTLAAHLATAALTAATVENRPLLRTSYPSAVSNETATTVGQRVFVTATWEPYPNASLGGSVAAGNEPPASADVAATTLTVHTGIDLPTDSERRSFEGLAQAIANAFVDNLFPPERTRQALLDPRTEPPTVERYQIVADAVGADVDAGLAAGNATRANGALARELAVMIEADLRAEHDHPTTAAAAVDVENATIVVRRWQP